MRGRHIAATLVVTGLVSFGLIASASAASTPQRWAGVSCAELVGDAPWAQHPRAGAWLRHRCLAVVRPTRCATPAKPCARWPFDLLIIRGVR